eukprot:TRINITY_DN1691_c0_g1_i6.p1 TRINITY_DN1691_c0_g1~~TRINITY_DN1691_c0_g1_i6.p1  ORF type:complete len:551 (+),score=149.36 TRINITY_DN1691_c0_g1_i6:66-1718(+)
MKCIPVLAVLVGLVNAEFLAKVHGAKKGAKGVYDINGFQMMVLDNMDEVGMMSTSGIQVEEAEDVTDKGYSFFTAPSLCGELDKDAQWGARSISGGSNYLAESYAFPQGGGGEGVVVYILDSGVRCSHAVFGGRCTTSTLGEGDIDGHGTHVAGIVAGISRKASIKSVRVEDDNGQISIGKLLSALQWTANDITAHGKPSVINLSLGGPRSIITNKAVEALSSSAVVVTAAGNDAIDACNTSPGSASNAINVGNAGFTDTAYKPNHDSNWGQCVNLYAPGVYVSSASHMSDNTYVRKSGTSMAAPHVAGVAANYLAAGVTPSYNSMLSVLQETALKNAIKNPKTGNASDSTLLHVPCSGTKRTADDKENCFGRFTHFSGSASLKYPQVGVYANNEFRCWKVSCPQSSVTMTYKSYDLQNNKDVLLVHLGTQTRQATGRITEAFVTKYDVADVMLQLITDPTVVGTGFSLEWECEAAGGSNTNYTALLVVIICVVIGVAVVVGVYFMWRRSPEKDIEAPSEPVAQMHYPAEPATGHWVPAHQPPDRPYKVG